MEKNSENRHRLLGLRCGDCELPRHYGCVPFGFAAALGAAGASAFLLRFRPWLLVLSITSIGVGFWQQRRARQCAVKGRLIGQFLLWTAVAIVLAMILFPQQIAGFLADHFYRS